MPCVLQATNQGLEALLNTYASSALALAALPVADISINNSNVLFIAVASSTDVYEGIDTLANHALDKVLATNTSLVSVQVSLLRHEWLNWCTDEDMSQLHDHGW